MDGTDSILESIKKLLGIHEDYTHFDQDLIMHINSVFMILTQLGVGPPEGFRLEDGFETWEDFTQDNRNIEAIKSYIHLKVKILFDPPLSSVVMEAVKQMINELEFRLNLEAETVRPSEEEVY